MVCSHIFRAYPSHLTFSYRTKDIPYDLDHINSGPADVLSISVTAKKYVPVPLYVMKISFRTENKIVWHLSAVRPSFEAILNYCQCSFGNAFHDYGFMLQLLLVAKCIYWLCVWDLRSRRSGILMGCGAINCLAISIIFPFTFNMTLPRRNDNGKNHSLHQNIEYISVGS